MDVRVTHKNGESFTLEEYGITAKDFIVSSIEILTDYGTVDGRHGTVDRGSIYGSRTITVPFIMHSKDLHDFALRRDKIFDLVLSTRSFYIQEMRRVNYLSYDFAQLGEGAKQSEGTENKLIGGKRYLVRLQNVFEIEQMFTYGFGELVFETTDLPYAESLGTTQDIHNNGINADDGLWGFGMGLEAVDESLIYTHNATVNKPFFIYNAGDVSIHPFEQKFKMTISNVRGSTERFQITNHTNGSRARINVPLRSTDVVVYDGPNVTRNKLTFLRDTRKDFIELSPGWNNFRIYYCDSATISFDFPFYYL